MKPNRHSPKALLGIALLAFVLAGAISSCSSSTDEQQIMEVIAKAEIAIETRDIADTLDLVTDDYKDQQGFDKTQLRQFLRAYFLTHSKIELLVHPGNIEFETKNLAHVTIAVMVGTKGTNDAFNGEAPTLQVEFHRGQSGWQVTRMDRVTQ